MTCLLALLPATGHDQMWLLLAAQRMGSHLDPYGPLVFESNPPLAIWLSAFVVALAGVLHVSLTVMFKLGVTLLAAGSAGVSAKLLRRLEPGLSSASLWFLGFVFVLVFGAVPARDFGQRDHVLTLLLLPYLLGAALDTYRRAPRLSPANRIVLTATAALGLALKPHQALIAVFVELTLLLRSTEWVPRRRRPADAREALYAPPLRLIEPFVFVVCAATYVGAIYVLAPTYFTQVLPIVRETYWAFGNLSLPGLVAQAPELYVLFLAALLFNQLLNRRLHESAIVPILGLGGAAATIAYWLQGTGWYYQQLPAISLFSLAVAFRLLDVWTLYPVRIPRWLPIPLGGLTLLALGLTIHFSEFEIVPGRAFPADIEQAQPVPDPAFFRDLPAGSAVATLTTSVDDTVPPAFRYRLVLAQRYPHLWMLPAILRTELGPAPSHRIGAEQLAELDRIQHRFMVEDLERWHPALILVERCQDAAVHCQVLEDWHDDLLAFFMRDAEFAGIFAHYRLVRRVGAYDGYVLADP